MNAYLNITVRVASQQANAALAQMDAKLKGLGASGAAGAGGLGILDRQLRASNIEKFGKNLQWTGRQLQYNFTLPLLLAGAAAGKFAYENENALTRVRMVYGNASEDQKMLGKETKALATSFELLSSRFGMNQAAVIKIGAAWAEAGVEGVALAKATRQTMEVMVLGQLDAEQATKGLMAIQSAYKLNTRQLHQEIAVLAAVNKTGTIEFGGLIEVIQRAGSVARASGIDIRHLAAMANLMVPAAGTAAQAGNALRTMISRLTAPTKDTVEILGMMGISIQSATWQAKNGVQRIETLATAFDKLSTSQRNQVASIVASRWQINRFDLLMEDVVKTNGAYAKALDQTKDPVRNLAVYQKMLNTYLSSSPEGLRIVGQAVKNELAKSVIGVLPALTALIAHVAQVLNWFTNLDPRIQQLILGFLIFTAAIGPVIKYFGAFATLIGIGMRLVNFFTIALNRKTAATIVSAAADQEHAASVGMLETALATARIAVGNFVLGLWSIATFPFQVVGAAAGLMWRGFLAGMPFVWRGLLATIQMISRIPIVAQTVEGIMSFIGTAIGAIWAAAASFAMAAWEFVGASLPGLWNTILFAADVAVTGIQYAWVVATNAIEAAWIAFTGFMSGLWALVEFGWIAALNGIEVAWRTLPAIMGIIGQGIVMLWTAVADAIELAWINLGNVVPLVWASVQITMAAIATAIVYLWGVATDAIELAFVTTMNAIEVAWRTLPVVVGIVGQGISIIWYALMGVLNGLWLATMAGLEAAWIAFQTFLDAAWALMPVVLSAAMAAIQKMWDATLAAMSFAWEFFTTMLPELLAAAGTAIALVMEAIVAILTSPWTLVIAGVVAFVLMFRKQIVGGIRSAIDWVVSAFNNLPSPIANAFRAVIGVVRRAIEIVRDLLSYMNPFARHSPSLVEQVAKGIDAIAKSYASLRNIGGNFRQAIADLEAFKAATQGIQDAQDKKQFDDIVALAPGSGDELIKIRNSIKMLKTDLDAVAREYFAQAAVVDIWKTKLDAANKSLDEQDAILTQLKDTAATLKDQLDQASGVLDALASMPITGMKAMNDQIFENEMAQKRLRLEIMKMEDAGGSIDDIRKKYEALQGEIELLSGQREDLRQAGAGSDVLKTYDDEINSLQSQQDQLQNTSNAMNDMQKQLDALQRTGQELDLEKSIQFDPLTKQIEEASKAYQEMPFDQIMSQITQQKGVVADLTKQWDDANKKVADQQIVVDKLKSARDSIQASYDVEKDKLDKLAAAYDGIEQQIQDMTSAMDTFSAAVKQAHQDQESLNAQIFDAGAGQNFDIPGGDSTLGREGGLKDIQDFNKQMEDEYQKTLHSLGKLDMFGPIKEMWKSAWGWVQKNIGPYVTPVWDKIKDGAKQVWGNLFGNVDTSQISGVGGILDALGQAWDNLGTKLEGTALGTTFDNLSDNFKRVTEIGGSLVGFFNDDLGPAIEDVVGWVVDAGKSLGGELKNWASLFDPFSEAIGHIWAVVTWFTGVLLDVFKVALGALYVIWSTIWPIIANVVKPIFDTIISVIRAALEIVRGVIAFILAIINGDWSAAWHAILTIVDGIWDLIYGVIKGALDIVWGLIKGVFFGIVGFFGSLWGTFLQPIFEGIWHGLEGIWNKITGVIKGAVNIVIDVLNALIHGINKIADILPGIDFKIPDIPKFGSGGGGGGGQLSPPAGGGFFARGGILPETEVRSGFTTNGPRAIVGEGNRLYPEFVVPTDPAHRTRALDLFSRLGAMLGVNGGRPGETGGFGLHTITDTASDLLGVLRKGAVTAAFAPFLAAANAAISLIPWDKGRDIANSMKNAVYNWAKGEDNKLGDGGTAGNANISGTGWRAITAWMDKNASNVPYRVTSTVRPGDPGFHGQGRAVDMAGMTPSWNSPALLSINKALLPVAGTLKELIYAGPGGQSFKNGSPYNYSSSVVEDHHDHVHAALAAGGRLRFARSTGGTLLRVAEGRHGEEIQVKPLSRNSSDSETHNHFYGDLSFPNVKDGNDAEAFIRNLESLV